MDAKEFEEAIKKEIQWMSILVLLLPVIVDYLDGVLEFNKLVVGYIALALMIAICMAIVKFFDREMASVIAKFYAGYLIAKYIIFGFMPDLLGKVLVFLSALAWFFYGAALIWMLAQVGGYYLHFFIKPSKA